jgi:hypothetical protein
VIGGHALTAVTAMVLGLAAVLGVACVLVVGERVGTAPRFPAEDTLFSRATVATGRGRGFAVHAASPALCAGTAGRHRSLARPNGSSG